MSFHYQEIGGNCVATFINNNKSLSEGNVCQICANYTMTIPSAGNDFSGVVVSNQGVSCAVSFSGFVTVPYTGTIPSIGYQSLVSDGSGGVMTGEGNKQYLVVAVSGADKTVTFLL